MSLGLFAVELKMRKKTAGHYLESGGSRVCNREYSLVSFQGGPANGARSPHGFLLYSCILVPGTACYYFFTTLWEPPDPAIRTWSAWPPANQEAKAVSELGHLRRCVSMLQTPRATYAHVGHLLDMGEAAERESQF